MGSDEAALLQLWREKRGVALPEDLSGSLIVQLGTASTRVEGEEFALWKPGRIQLFLYFWRMYSNHLPLMSWKLYLINYYMAFGALIAGFDRLPLLECLRER
jgi:hypothetical protein